jgi:CMP-N-acetylneuraminic acid synthetase
LATDNTPTADVVRHAIDWLESMEGYFVDNVLVLEPTSPGRQIGHINQTIELLSKNGVDTVASIAPVPHHFHRDKQLRVIEDNQLVGLDDIHPSKMIHRRQDLPESFALDGTIFACNANVVKSDPPTLWGRNVQALLVDSRYCVDLDGPEDWKPSEEKLRELLLSRA